MAAVVYRQSNPLSPWLWETARSTNPYWDLDAFPWSRGLSAGWLPSRGLAVLLLEASCCTAISLGLLEAPWLSACQGEILQMHSVWAPILNTCMMKPSGLGRCSSVCIVLMLVCFFPWLFCVPVTWLNCQELWFAWWALCVWCCSDQWMLWACALWILQLKGEECSSLAWGPLKAWLCMYCIQSCLAVSCLYHLGRSILNRWAIENVNFDLPISHSLGFLLSTHIWCF